MGKEKVSIITAVYKSEEFLTRCVNSILKQTWQNFELLLIDDGSPDNCPQMCDEFAKKDQRVKVIHKKNGGVSSAWNAGLDNVTGDYITFVDSDDFVEPSYVEELYKTLKHYNADIAICRNDEIKEDVISEGKHKSVVAQFYPASECLKAFLAEKVWSYSVWAKLYKKEIFNELRYPENIMRTEDFYVLCDLCKQVKNGIATNDKILYHYVIQNQSVSRTVNEKKFDTIRAHRHILDQLISDNECYVYVVQNLFWSYNTIYRLFKGGKRNDLIKELNVWFK